MSTEATSAPVLSASPRADEPIDKTAPAPDADGASWIRGIPLIGDSIADSYKEEKMREPVRDEDRVSAEDAPKVEILVNQLRVAAQNVPTPPGSVCLCVCVCQEAQCGSSTKDVKGFAESTIRRVFDSTA